MSDYSEMEVRRVLLEAGELHEHATDVAQQVYKLRWPHGGRISIEVNLNWVLEDSQIGCSYWVGGGNESFNYPMSYLWSTDAEIKAGEIERARQEEAAAAAKHQARLDDLLAQRRRQYLLLKSEFEPTGSTEA